MKGLSKNEVALILKRLERQKIKKDSHLFVGDEEELIGDVANRFYLQYCNEAIKMPAIALLRVILSSRNNYSRIVKPRMDRIIKEEKDMYSFTRLSHKTKTFDGFIELCRLKSKKKYIILTNVLNEIENQKMVTGIQDDFKVVEKWAKDADYKRYKKDPIGSIWGVGISTFQHLRMNFGVDTAKPDQRVVEVLNKEFGFYSSKAEHYIGAVEKIASLVGRSVLYIDQVFVNYGSGYYTTDAERTTLRKKDKNLINKNQIKKKEDKMEIEIMINYVEESFRGKDIYGKSENERERPKGGYIIVPRELHDAGLEQGKNVVTYWKQYSNQQVKVDLRGFGIKYYKSVKEMEEDDLRQKIRDKYDELIKKFHNK